MKNLKRNINLEIAFVAILFVCFLISGSPLIHASNDASVDGIMNKASDSGYKNQKMALEVAQLIYDAPTQSSRKSDALIKPKDKKNSSSAWSSVKYFASVDEMLNTQFFRDFLIRFAKENSNHMNPNEDASNSPGEFEDPITGTPASPPPPGDGGGGGNPDDSHMMLTFDAFGRPNEAPGIETNFPSLQNGASDLSGASNSGSTSNSGNASSSAIANAEL